MADAKIKLVVLNENTLGYIQPELPNYVQHLHASVLRGAYQSSPSLIGSTDKVRLASENDFSEYRVHFGSFGNKDEYEFAESVGKMLTFDEAINIVLEKRAVENAKYR